MLSHVIKVLYIVMVGFLSQLVLATEGLYQEGVHYKKLDMHQDYQNKTGLIEVTKIFQYGCHACYDVHKNIIPWLEKNADVQLIDVPAIFSGKAKFEAKIFFIKNMLEHNEVMNDMVYKQFYELNKPIKDYNEMKIFFVGNGYSEEKVKVLFYGDELAVKLKGAGDVLRKYSITKTPTLIIGGKYKVEPSPAVMNEKILMDVVDYLVQQERVDHKKTVQ